MPKNTLLRSIVSCSVLGFPLVVSAQYQTQGSTALATTNATQPSVASRIEKANEEFASALASDPDRPIAILASFRTTKAAADVVTEARAYGLRIEGFRHSDIAGSGGYTMKPGETVEQALSQYEYDRKFFTEQHITEADQLLTQTGDSNQKQVLQSDRELLLERQKRFRVEPLMVVGIDLFGPPRVLSEYSKARPYVRVMEIKTGTRINAAIRPQD